MVSLHYIIFCDVEGRGKREKERKIRLKNIKIKSLLFIRWICDSQRNFTKFNFQQDSCEHCIKLTIILFCMLSSCGYFPFSLPTMNSKCARLISLALTSLAGTQLANEKAILNYWPCTWVFVAHGGISCCPFFPLSLLLVKTCLVVDCTEINLIIPCLWE